MAELLGQSIVYSGTEMKIGSRLVTHAPVYAETVKTERTFFVEYNVRRSELGIKTETILMVTVSASPRQRIYEPGEFVIIKGIDSLIIPWQGVFYELRRLRSCGKEGGKDLN
jgi:hypothetical protein